jgi:predicted permease
LNIFFQVLTQNILPVLLVASFGYLLRRRFDTHVATLSTVVFNVLSPCLVFSSLVESQLPGEELVELVGFSVIYIFAMGGLAFGLARLFRLGRVDTAALLIVTMFVNGGNYGLTLLHLRYGDGGLSRGVVYFVTSSVLLYTIGVFIASLGRASRRETLGRMTRMPAVYAALLAIIVYSLHIPVPQPIMSGITIAGSGAIPVMLLVLGMQIAELRPENTASYTWPAVGLRLIGGPLVGLAVASALGLQGIGRSAMIVEAAMPTAVFNLILASEFGLPTSIVARIVVFSTLISPLTIAAAITVLGL